MVAVRSSGSYTAENVDQTIATVVAGDTFVYLGAISDSDNVHAGIDSAPTLGGVSMTPVPGINRASGPVQVDVYILANCAGGTNQTLHTAYHAGSPGYMGAWYVITAAKTTQAGNNQATSSAGATTASNSVTSTANDLLIDIIAANATPTATGGQTVDFTGSGNGSSFAVGRKTASASSTSSSYSLASSAAYTYTSLVVQASAGGGAVAYRSLLMLGV